MLARVRHNQPHPFPMVLASKGHSWTMSQPWESHDLTSEISGRNNQVTSTMEAAFQVEHDLGGRLEILMNIQIKIM